MSNDQDPTGLAGHDMPPSSASSGRDGVVNNSGIDTIRDLLRKLEDAAAELPMAASPANLPPANDALAAATPAKTNSEGLATLRRTAKPTPALAPIEIGPVAVDLRTVGPVSAGVGKSRSRGAGWAIGVGSFALGVSAAAGIIIALDPFKSAKAPQQVVAEARSVGAPSTTPTSVASAAQPAGGGRIEVAAAPPAASPPTASLPAGDAPSAETAVPVRTAEAPRSPEQVPAASAAPAVVSGQGPAAGGALVSPVAAKSVTFVLASNDRVELRPGERKSLGLRLEPMPTETDTLLVVVRGVPEWLSVSKGSTIGEEIWLMPGHHATDVSLIAAEAASGSADISVQLAHLDGRILAETRISVRATRPLAQSPMVAAVPEAGEQNTLRMLARGELLLDTGEIEAARLLLRTAAEAGSVAAAMKLAQTYDPGEMQRLGMADASADPTQAVRWYEKAHALGSPAASARISALAPR